MEEKHIHTQNKQINQESTNHKTLRKGGRAESVDVELKYRK